MHDCRRLDSRPDTDEPEQLEHSLAVPPRVRHNRRDSMLLSPLNPYTIELRSQATTAMCGRHNEPVDRRDRSRQSIEPVEEFAVWHVVRVGVS